MSVRNMKSVRGYAQLVADRLIADEKAQAQTQAQAQAQDRASTILESLSRS